ncbi:MAG: hypothetical protein V7724_09575 [Sediminicola sp.]
MEWDFLYDENEGKKYRSVKDWYRDIKHLVGPLIAMSLLAMAVFFLVDHPLS